MRKTLVIFCSFVLTLAAVMVSPAILQGRQDESQTAPVDAGVSRADGATRVDITLAGSKQNPAWSPDGTALLFTRFRNGYNEEPADLYVVEISTGTLRKLVSDGSGNVNLPGSSWNPITHQIVFSSSRNPHDEIYLINEAGSPGGEMRVTSRVDRMAYEASFSPDGQWIVFESHLLDVEGNGVIVKYRVDGTVPYEELTGALDDCRQPNWSPAGNGILYQRFASGQWDIWVMNVDGTNPRKVTGGAGDKTDASFSPDGRWIVYSSDEGGLEFANLFIIPTTGGKPKRLTHYAGYDGAPSWSADGRKVVFESHPGDPDGSAGTTIWMINVPILNRSAVFRSIGVQDGWLLESSETSGVGGMMNASGTSLQVGDNAQDRQFRAILHFDTSGLPDGAVVLKATLKVRLEGVVGMNPFGALGQLRADMRVPFFGSGAGLAVSDFQALPGKTAVASFVSTPINGWYVAVLNASGRAGISRTGSTQFRLYFSLDDNDNWAADHVKLFSGNQVIAVERPLLTVEYYVP